VTNLELLRGLEGGLALHIFINFGHIFEWCNFLLGMYVFQYEIEQRKH